MRVSSHFINFKNKRVIAFCPEFIQIIFLMIEKNDCLFLLSCMLWGCASAPDPEPVERHPPVGIVRSVNLHERYLVFEAEFRTPPGQEMRLLRDGLPVGRLQAGAVRKRKFQSADILEGSPRVGDLVEPRLSSAQP